MSTATISKPTKTLIVCDHGYHGLNYARKHNIDIMDAVIVTPNGGATRAHGLIPKTIVDLRQGRSVPVLDRRMDDFLRIVRHGMPKPRNVRSLLSIQDRFERFHAENPSVYRRLEEMTRSWLAFGNRRASIHMLWETLRWQAGTGAFGKTGEDFKLNDHYAARYARLLVEKHPEWESVFNLRALRAA